MKTTKLTHFLWSLLMLVSINGFSQFDTPRGSQKAKITQTIGITDITITYSRPSVRKRQIWGKLVPYGMTDLRYGTAKLSPWRAGADENTIIEFEHDVKVEGKEIKAGKYGFHIVVNEDNTATIIFNKNYSAWGSYFYDASQDALQVTVKTSVIPHKEQLAFEFNKLTRGSVEASLNWEKKQFPFKIEVDVAKYVLDGMKTRLQNQPGFQSKNWETAASYALRNNRDLEEALGWINGALSGKWYSKETFNGYIIKADILAKLGKQDEGLKLLDAYMPKTSSQEAYQYGLKLLKLEMKDKAMEVFKMNEKKHKNVWPVHYGLAKGYSAKGDYKKALKHMKKAQSNATIQYYKNLIKGSISKLEKGEDIN